MFRKILIISSTAILFNLPALGCDQNLLASEAESLNTKIWASVDVTEDIIKERLFFLRDEKEVDSRYSEDKNFEIFSGNLIKEKYDQIKPNTFLVFTKHCIDLYNKISDPSAKMAIYILLEKVQEKFLITSNEFMRFKSWREKEATKKVSSNMEKMGNFLKKFMDDDGS